MCPLRWKSDVHFRSNATSIEVIENVYFIFDSNECVIFWMFTVQFVFFLLNILFKHIHVYSGPYFNDIRLCGNHTTNIWLTDMCIFEIFFHCIHTIYNIFLLNSFNWWILKRSYHPIKLHYVYMCVLNFLCGE